MMKPPFLPVAHPVLDGNERLYVNECLQTSWISANGRFVPLFEEAFARFCGVDHAVAVSSGTAALHLALLALGVGPGDEVIVPALTYVATANAVVYCGARPVFADSDPQTWNLDPAGLEELITPRTRGIIVVHLYGHPADMDPILETAARHGLFVLEDAAQAHGAEYKHRRVGGWGDAAVFSFFGNKIITTGEGGMVVTRDPALAEKVRLLRGQGMDPQRRYWFPVVGYNYRMTNLQAAVGLAQLERIEQRLEERRRLAAWYDRRLEALQSLLVRPCPQPWARHVCWLYSVVLRETVPVERDEVMAALAQRGIETRPVFWPVHLLPPYAPVVRPLPVSENISRRGLSLPTHSLLTEADVERVADALAAVCLRQPAET
jgi:perosamine synthetase